MFGLFGHQIRLVGLVGILNSPLAFIRQGSKCWRQRPFGRPPRSTDRIVGVLNKLLPPRTEVLAIKLNYYRQGSRIKDRILGQLSIVGPTNDQQMIKMNFRPFAAKQPNNEEQERIVGCWRSTLIKLNSCHDRGFHSDSIDQHVGDQNDLLLADGTSFIVHWQGPRKPLDHGPTASQGVMACGKAPENRWVGPRYAINGSAPGKH